MEENRENPKIAGIKQERNPDGTFLKGVSGNPAGRPVGSLDFKTKFEIFLDKLAKQNNMSPQEIDEQLFAVAYKKAKEGDYQFWKDVHDRIYGKPLQSIDHTTKGKEMPQPLLYALFNNDSNETSSEPIQED